MAQLQRESRCRSASCASAGARPRAASRCASSCGRRRSELWEGRVSTRHDSPGGGPEAAVLEALALDAEKLALAPRRAAARAARARAAQARRPRARRVRARRGARAPPGLRDERDLRAGSAASCSPARARSGRSRPTARALDSLLESARRLRAAARRRGARRSRRRSRCTSSAWRSVRTGLAVPLGRARASRSAPRRTKRACSPRRTSSRTCSARCT